MQLLNLLFLGDSFQYNLKQVSASAIACSAAINPATTPGSATLHRCAGGYEQFYEHSSIAQQL
jgi:hypothetical protein